MGRSHQQSLYDEYGELIGYLETDDDHGGVVSLTPIDIRCDDAFCNCRQKNTARPLPIVNANYFFDITTTEIRAVAHSKETKPEAQLRRQ